MLAADHFLYDLQAAVEDRILPVTMVAPQEIWEYLWPRDGAEQSPTVATVRLLEAAKASPHFPVLPDRSVLWQALQEGAREHRWVLSLRGPSLAIGAQEMQGWPGTPRFDEATEVWTYQAALDQHIYPRQTGAGIAEDIALIPIHLRRRCWPSGAAEVNTEDLERFARSIWPEVNRPHLEDVLREGVRMGTWAAWKQGSDETFFTEHDVPAPPVHVGPQWVLVDPTSALAQRLDVLRPGRGPQPVEKGGTPREVLVHIWDELVGFRDVQVAEMILTVTDRDSFDNTLLLATWADRPRAASAYVSVMADGQREISGKQETVHLAFEGRFEEVRPMLSPIWPFKSQGELEITIAVHLTYAPPLALADSTLETYRTALMNANQGSLEVRVVPARLQRPGGA